MPLKEDEFTNDEGLKDKSLLDDFEESILCLGVVRDMLGYSMERDFLVDEIECLTEIKERLKWLTHKNNMILKSRNKWM